ncbi:MAG TPA: ammonia channel protein, partial [Verrucomicrobiae bacterium]
MKRIILTIALMATAAFGAISARADTSTNLPAPTLEQRVAGLEAYIANSDPSASLKDTNGNMICQPTPVMNTAGPGHNTWMMTSTALVLFMTLPGLALFYGG